MVTSLNQSKPAREAGYEMVQYIAARLVLNGADAAVKIGAVPAGSILLGVHSRIVTAFSGGTPVLGVGTTQALVGATGNIFQPITATPGGTSTTNVPSVTIAEPFAADTDLWVGTSGAATAGEAVVAVAFIKPLA